MLRYSSRNAQILQMPGSNYLHSCPTCSLNVNVRKECIAHTPLARWPWANVHSVPNEFAPSPMHWKGRVRLGHTHCLLFSAAVRMLVQKWSNLCHTSHDWFVHDHVPGMNPALHTLVKALRDRRLGPQLCRCACAHLQWNNAKRCGQVSTIKSCTEKSNKTAKAALPFTFTCNVISF